MDGDYFEGKLGNLDLKYRVSFLAPIAENLTPLNTKMPQCAPK
jgi:hypothetical protein